ncbi:MAG: hypothetical protein IT305_24220, partial [Chloroflexi bacterium]|nr:hypothetical protein [Chloroflexota bacterium]
MDSPRRAMPWSRRTFFRRVGGLSVVLVLAACGQPAAPASKSAAPTPAGAAPSGPAASKPVATTAPAAPAAAPAPTTAAAAKPTAEIKPVASGVFNVWFSANWNTVTDEAVGNTFVEWGKQNGGLKVEWQSIPGSPQQLAKESAALAAG